jgi:uncharacterized protein YajQ (UPF0234 family)
MSSRQRYDFKGTDTEVERTELGFVIKSSTEGRIEAAYEVLQEKLAKRKVSLKEPRPAEDRAGPKSSYKQAILLKEGIAVEKAREIVQKITERQCSGAWRRSWTIKCVWVSGQEPRRLADRHPRAAPDGPRSRLQFINMRD